MPKQEYMEADILLTDSPCKYVLVSRPGHSRAARNAIYQTQSGEKVPIPLASLAFSAGRPVLGGAHIGRSFLVVPSEAPPPPRVEQANGRIRAATANGLMGQKKQQQQQQETR